MPKVTIDGIDLEVAPETNLVDAAAQADLEIPHYCYHPGLSVAGNCRMCLVDIRALSEKQNSPLPKLQIACNTIVQDGMVVETKNEKVQAARSSVLEFLLINHPIDCPICDQAGECKLQEYYMDYGRYRSRFELEEKVHKHKVLPVGKDIMLDQERCILCTRCVRFLDEVTETHELTITERGDHSELTLAAGASVDNDYSTNIVDICPVGALTSRRFRFQARVWYLDAASSICAGCSTGCNIEVHSRRGTIYRLKPRYNPDVNGYWMCDHGRTTFEDPSSGARLHSSLARDSYRFVELDSVDVGRRAAQALSTARRVAVVASGHVTMEEGVLLTEILEKLGGGKRILLSPPTSEIPDDGTLISTDRFPNRRGLAELGFEERVELPAGVDAVILARVDPAGEPEARRAEWAAALENLDTTIVLDERVTETTAYADHVLAATSHFESEGSFVNRDGRIQRFQAAVPPPGSAVAGWVALAAVLSALGGSDYDSLESVMATVTRRIGADRKTGTDATV
jgi:NADH-quinone oxidoreductase subunit G